MSVEPFIDALQYIDEATGFSQLKLKPGNMVLAILLL